MGPVITDESKKRVLSYIEMGEKEGAVVARDGRNRSGCQRRRLLSAPPILDKSKARITRGQGRDFWSTLVGESAEDLKEAIDIVSRSEYGNAASSVLRDPVALRAQFTQNDTVP